MRAVGHGAGAEPLRLSMGGPTVHMGWGPGRGVEGTTSGPGVLRVCEQPPRSCLRLGSTGRPRGAPLCGTKPSWPGDRGRPSWARAGQGRGAWPVFSLAAGMPCGPCGTEDTGRTEDRWRRLSAGPGRWCEHHTTSGPHRPHSGSWQGAATPHRSEAAGTRARTGSGPELQVPG